MRVLFSLLLGTNTIALSHCTRDAALRLQCERIINIYKVPFFPLIALTHRVIAPRLCERTFMIKVVIINFNQRMKHGKRRLTSLCIY